MTSVTSHESNACVFVCPRATRVHIDSRPPDQLNAEDAGMENALRHYLSCSDTEHSDNHSVLVCRQVYIYISL